MSSRRRVIGVHIEGLVGDVTTESDGGCYYYSRGGDLAPDASSSDYDWIDALVDLPASVATSVDFLTGQWQMSAFGFRLAATDAIAARLLVSSPESGIVLSADRSAAATSIAITGGTLTAGDIIYVNDETMRVVSSSGSGNYVVGRGYAGSTAQAHDAGSYVLDRPPYYVPRLVKLVEHDPDTGAEIIRWRGYIDAPPRLDGPSIVFSASEAYQRWRQVAINREPTDFNSGPIDVVRYTDDRIVMASATAPTVRSTTGTVCVQVAGAIAEATYDATAQRVIFNSDTDDFLLSSSFELDAEEPGIGYTYTEPVWELLVWDRDADIAPITGATRFHPIRIAQELLEGDELADAWTLGVAHIDYAAFEAEIAALPDLAIDFLVLGWDGQEVRPFEVAERLLRAFGYVPSITDAGVYTVRRVTIPTVDQVDGAGTGISTLPDGRYEILPPQSAGVTEISLTVGALPWREGATALVRAVGGSQRARLMDARKRVDYTFDFLDRARVLDIATQLADSAALIHFGLPRVAVTVRDHEVENTSYALGDTIRLADLGGLETAWWIDRDGNRIAGADFSGRLDTFGVITSRRWDIPRGRFDLELSLYLWRSQQYVRHRAPAGQVNTWDSGTNTVELGDAIASSADADFFSTGDEVALWTRDGVKRSTTYPTVDNISGDQLELTGGFGGTTPAAGDILRLAPSSTYSNDTIYSTTTRPYVFLADASDEITHEGDTEDADIYGGGTGVSA